MDLDPNLYSILPPQSAAKLIRLLDQREAAHEAVLAAGQRFHDAHDDFLWIGRHRMAADQKQGIQAAHAAYFPNAAEEIDPADHELVAAKARMDRASAARDAASDAWEQFSFLTRTTDWVKMWAAHGGRLSYRDLPEVRLTRGETYQEATQRIREQIVAVDEEWQRVEEAPRTLDALKDEIAAQVDKIASTGRPRFLDRDSPIAPIDLDSTIRAPRILPRDPVNLPEVLRLQMSGERLMYDLPTPFIFWLDRDRILDRLFAEAEKLDFSDAMDDDQRETAFSRLLDQRLSLAWEEEATIEAAAAQGTTIVRRADVDPRPVLQVSEFSGGEVEAQRPARRRAPVQQDAAE